MKPKVVPMPLFGAERIGVFGKIDEFGAELQVLMFRDGDEFRNTQVSVMQGRPAKCANATSTESSCGCGRDRRWIKPRKAATQSCARVRSRVSLGEAIQLARGKPVTTPELFGP